MRVVRSVVTMDAHLVASLAVQMVDKTVDTTAARQVDLMDTPQVAWMVATMDNPGTKAIDNDSERAK